MVMFPWSAAAIEATGRYMKMIERAKEIDPEAFQPVMLPHFSDKQLWDQTIAIEKARSAIKQEGE